MAVRGASSNGHGTIWGSVLAAGRVRNRTESHQPGRLACTCASGPGVCASPDGRMRRAIPLRWRASRVCAAQPSDCGNDAPRRVRLSWAAVSARRSQRGREAAGACAYLGGCVRPAIRPWSRTSRVSASTWTGTCARLGAGMRPAIPLRDEPRGHARPPGRMHAPRDSTEVTKLADARACMHRRVRPAILPP
jgi:hypothetical protein